MIVGEIIKEVRFSDVLGCCGVQIYGQTTVL